MPCQEVWIRMRKNVFIAYVVLGLAAVLLSGCARPQPETEQMLQLDSPAPEFALPDLGGQTVALNDFKGKVVMIEFWATWCGPCRMSMPLMETLQKEFANDMVLLAVNLQENKEEVLDYVRAQGVHSRVLLDEEGSVGSVYGADSIPMQILIDRKGIVRHIQAGLGQGTASQLRSQIQKLVSMR